MIDENPYQAPRAGSVKDAGTSQKQVSRRPTWHYAVSLFAGCLVLAPLGAFFGSISDGALGGGHGSAWPGSLFIGLPLLIMIPELVSIEWIGLGVYLAYVCAFVLIWRIFDARSAARVMLVTHSLSVLSFMIVLSGLGWTERKSLPEVFRLMGMPLQLACAAFLLLAGFVSAIAMKARG